MCNDHLQLVKEERTDYHEIIDGTREKFKGDRFLVAQVPGSYKGAMHISFDFVQQVHILNKPQQPGPMYFLVPYKVGIFGVLNDTTKRQCNYLIPEAANFPKSKGANGVVSLLHHYFENYGHDEEELFLHADNCNAQNKNNCVMQYFAWRVATRLHQKITISFLPTGHTKFGPDYAFGLFKKKFRLSESSCVNDIANVISCSTPQSHLNYSCLVGDDTGLLFLNIYDFQAGFSEASFATLPNVTKYSHFHFDAERIGQVCCKENLNDEGVIHQIFDANKEVPEITSFGKVDPEGLSQQRKAYLYHKIRPYCSEFSKDLLCPLPVSMPEAGANLAPRVLSFETSEDPDDPEEPHPSTSGESKLDQKRRKKMTSSTKNVKLKKNKKD